jgi:hypothetical protein
MRLCLVTLFCILLPIVAGLVGYSLGVQRQTKVVSHLQEVLRDKSAESDRWEYLDKWTAEQRDMATSERDRCQAALKAVER